MATRTKKQRRAQKRQQLQAAQRPAQRRKLTEGRSAWALATASVLLALATAVAIIYTATRGSDGNREEGPVAAALPDTPDYHSLLVAPTDARSLVLGTHNGLYRSPDGGRTWQEASLAGQDAMNLARATRDVVWAAGHDVLAKSADGGETWEDVLPNGLSSFDVHAFAVDPSDPRTLYAAIAGEGLFRSNDGGRSFGPISREVGPGVMALAVTPNGRILAGEMEAGLMVSADGGKTWKRTLEEGLMGLAVNPKDPRRILATGPGILLSRDGGTTWVESFGLGAGAGPVAWAPSDPKTAYVVGLDQVLYKTTNGGETWKAVT
jgi:photosystem II stability/assembly factor-like uncharacterized protein